MKYKGTLKKIHSPGNFSPDKTYSNLVEFGSYFIVHSLEMGQFFSFDEPLSVCGGVNFPKVWSHTPVQIKSK